MDFKTHLKTYLNDEEIDSLLSALKENSKNAALLNLEKMSDEEFLSLYPNVIPHPIVKHAYLYDKNEYELGKSIYHFLGCFYLQEPSAMLPSFYLNPNEDDYVLDLCAAPGGKSIQASLLMSNKGMIISNDLSRQRCSAILENVERLGRANMIITNNDFSKIYKNYSNFFSKIILDAPCSGSGMFRKEEKMEDDWSINKVEKFASIQKELILMCYEMLKEGGEMVYSTCSFSYEEDEEVIDYLLKNTNATLITIPSNDLLYVSRNLPYGVHTLPNLFPGEGHYICLIKKPGQPEINQSKEKEKIPNYLKGLNIDSRLGHFEKYGDYVFGFNHITPKLPNLYVIRYGVKVAEINKDIIKPDYHYSRFASLINNVEINDEELKKYLHGDVINKDSSKGWVQISYKRKSLAFGKSDGRIIKNHLPKGLRH